MHEPDKPKKMNEIESAGESPASPSPELQAIEAQWSRLPRADRIDRDRLMFLAGQASVAGRVDQSRPARLATWFWPASCAGMTAVAAALFAMLVLRPEPQVAERAVHGAQQPATRDWNARPEAAGDAAFGIARMSTGAVVRGTWTAGMALCLGDDLLALAPPPNWARPRQRPIRQANNRSCRAARCARYWIGKMPLLLINVDRTMQSPREPNYELSFISHPRSFSRDHFAGDFGSLPG